MCDFPWRIYSTDILLKEYEKLKKTPININEDNQLQLKRNNVGYKCSNYFFQYERCGTNTRGQKTAVNYWNTRREYVLQRQSVDTHDVFGIIGHLCHLPSQFPPTIAVQCFQFFQPKRIVDFFAGWGDRCLASMACDIDYIGIDSNYDLKKYYRQMINFYPSKSNIELLFQPLENVNINDRIRDGDLIFTSPPFWDHRNRLYDQYNHMNVYESSYEFIFQFSLILSKIFEQKTKVIICLHLPVHMYDILVSHIGVCDHKLSYTSSGNKQTKSNTNTIYCWDSKLR